MRPEVPSRLRLSLWRAGFSTFEILYLVSTYHVKFANACSSSLHTSLNLGQSIEDKHSVSTDLWSYFADSPERNLALFIPQGRQRLHINGHNFRGESTP